MTDSKQLNKDPIINNEMVRLLIANLELVVQNDVLKKEISTLKEQINDTKVHK